MYRKYDMVNAHPHLLVKVIKAKGLQGDFCMLEKYCQYPSAWRAAIASYLEVDPGDAKIELIKIFYGSKPSSEIPLTHNSCAKPLRMLLFFAGSFFLEVNVQFTEKSESFRD